MTRNKGFLDRFAYILLAIAVNSRRKMFSDGIISCHALAAECAIARQMHATPIPRAPRRSIEKETSFA